MIESALASLASTGVVGVVLVVALLALRKKDDDLRDESRGRLEDATRFLTLATALSKETTTSVVALTDIVKKWEKREEEQDRLEHELASRHQPAPPPFPPLLRPLTPQPFVTPRQIRRRPGE